MKYRKKPVEVEAWQFNECVVENLAGLPEWIFAAILDERIRVISPDKMAIGTLEGVMAAKFGDYIIKDVKGEFYPCKPDIFEMTYEPVE